MSENPENLEKKKYEQQVLSPQVSNQNTLQQQNAQLEALITDPNAIAQVEKDNEYIENLLKDIPELELFKVKYNNLYSALQGGYSNEQRYMKQCKEYAMELASLNAKLQGVTEMTQSNDENLLQQKEKLEEIKLNVQRENQKINEHKDKIQKQKDQFIDLEQSKNEQIRLAELEQQKILNEQKKQYEELKKNLEQQMQKMEELNEDTLMVDREYELKLEQNKKLNKEVEDISQKIEEINQLITNAKEEQDEIQLKIKEVEIEQNEVNALLSEKEEILRKKKEEYEKLPIEKDKLQSKKDELNQKVKQLDKDLKRAERINQETQEKQGKIVLEIDENSKLNEELKLQVFDLEKTNQGLVKTQIALSKLINNLKNERDDLQRELDHQIQLEKTNQDDLDKYKKERDKYQEEINILQRDKKDIDKELKDVQDRDHAIDGDIIQQLNRQRKLQNQINAYKHETDRLRNVITQLQKEQEKYGIEASQAHAKYYQTIEEVKIKNSQITELQKKNAEVEAKLKHQQNLYEAVRSDRNLYSKNLLESQDEIDELQKKYTRMTHQVDQFKEEIKQKDASLVKEDFEFNKIVEENKTTKLQKKRIKKAIKSTEEVIKSQEQHTSRLKYVIQEAKQEKQRNSKDLDMVINERDILGTQLIKRNQELNVLYEKIKLSQSNLAKGEIFYREKQKELESLKEELTVLINELKGTNDQTSCTDDLSKEINKLDKDILQAKTRVKALADELENPLNIHRWRKLEATDQELFEKILKIQTLQRRLIAKTEEVKEKDNLIKEKEKLFMELKNILARQPGAEIHQQLAQYKESLKEKQGSMKKMNAQLKQAIDSVDLLKFENNRLRGEIQKMKQQYFQKRREQDLSAKSNNYDQQYQYNNPAGGIIYDQYNPEHNPDLIQNQEPAPM